MKTKLLLLVLAVYYSTISFAQCSGTVLSLSAPNPSQTGTTGTWTVPSGGPYKVRITAKGAKGGIGNCCGSPVYNGGSGAVTVGEFIFSSGQIIEAIAGAPGFGDGVGGAELGQVPAHESKTRIH